MIVDNTVSPLVDSTVKPVAVSKPEIKSGEKIRYLEGLRGIAAIMVLFCHLRNTCFFIEQEKLNALIGQLPVPGILKHFFINSIGKLVDGNISVWIFWVLSSYVISIQFFKPNQDYNKTLISSFSKRYFRLLIPVLVSVLFAYILLRGGLMYNYKLATLLGPRYIDFWLGSFYNFSASLFGALKSAFYETFFNFQYSSTYNSILWSIEAEFLGSLFIFSVFGVIRHNSYRYILYAVILLILLKLQMHWLCAFVFGYILCDYDYSVTDNKYISQIKRIEGKVHAFGFVILVLSLLLIVFGEQFMTKAGIPGSYQFLFLSVAIVYFSLRSKYYKSFFSAKVPFWLGKVSFGLYLLHLPIICSFTSYIILNNNTLTGKILACAATVALTLVSAHFFTKYVDKTGIVYSNKIGNFFKKAS